MHPFIILKDNSYIFVKLFSLIEGAKASSVQVSLRVRRRIPESFISESSRTNIGSDVDVNADVKLNVDRLRKCRRRRCLQLHIRRNSGNSILRF
jgi:hypothetical protein